MTCCILCFSSRREAANLFLAICKSMVLFVHGTKIAQVPSDSRSLYALSPSLKENGAEFGNRNSKMVGPIGLLYVAQREFATVAPQDSKNALKKERPLTSKVPLSNSNG